MMYGFGINMGIFLFQSLDDPSEPRPGHCPRCGAEPFHVVAVHGHRQCVACGANVEPCCED